MTQTPLSPPDTGSLTDDEARRRLLDHLLAETRSTDPTRRFGAIDRLVALLGLSAEQRLAQARQARELLGQIRELVDIVLRASLRIASANLRESDVLAGVHETQTEATAASPEARA